MGLKMLSYGLYQSKMSYFRDNWNILDFLILAMTFVFYYYFENININFVSFRVFKLIKLYPN